jgi:hypothetical protein
MVPLVFPESIHNICHDLIQTVRAAYSKNNIGKHLLLSIDYFRPDTHPMTKDTERTGIILSLRSTAQGPSRATTGRTPRVKRFRSSVFASSPAGDRGNSIPVLRECAP